MSQSTLSNPRAGGSAASDGGDGRPAPESAADTTNGARRGEGTDDEDNRTIAQLVTANPNSTPPAAPPRGRQRYTKSVLKKAEEKIRELAGIAETEQHTEAHIDDNLACLAMAAPGIGPEDMAAMDGWHENLRVTWDPSGVP